MLSLEAFVALMIGAVSIPAFAMFVLGCSSMQVAPDRMHR